MAYEGGHPFPVKSGGTGDASLTAYSVLCGGTTSTASFQNVSGLGSSGQLLTSNGASALPTWQAASGSGISSIAEQVFTSSGTYTPTSGMIYCTVECLGGGGGGGGTGASATAGAGGAAGGYCKKTFSAATIGSSQTVTIGSGGSGNSNASGSAGGNTTFGSLLTANGGNGGSVGAAVNNQVTGPSGGTATGGDINITGGSGGYSIHTNGVSRGLRAGGNGAGTQYGGGGGGAYGVNLADQVGNNASGYGAGGGGSFSSSSTNQAGGNGSGGIIIILEYV